jgi:PAS domain S-box-containing protein
MTQQQKLAKQVFAGNSEMAILMRSHDWSKTSLGSPQQWSQSLKTAVRIMLTSRQPMFVWWGEELINLYNDAYIPTVGSKHPDALGQPASIVWQEIWDQVGPRAESAMFNNEGTYDEALLLIMERNGYPEETYYTFSYSPIPDDQNGMGGIICANIEDTQRIIGERQLALLRELAAKTADARTFNEACTVSASCLGTNPYDLPFAMIYLVEPDRQQISLAGTSGIDRNHAAVPEIVDLTSDSAWSFAKVIKTHQVSIISDLEASFDNLPTGAWQQPPHQAVAVPIAPSGQAGKAGILVAGLNPFRLFDDSYRGFIDLVAAQISASIANAQAYEEERKRADALAELDRAKTVFFSNVSHEFRTPLTLMLGPLEETLSNATGLNPGDREQLTTVHRNSLRLLKLVNTLLDFSRIEAGRIQAVYQPTDLAKLTADLAGMFRSATDRAGLRLVVDCHPLSETAYVDPEMWEKIVLNLLSNAFKFTFEGEIAVALRNSPDRIELEIRDTGTGIPTDELPHIFERFHRVQGAKGRTYEGSGIGLSLVQELVALHGGTIQVNSIVDKGTSFTVSIPTGSAHLPSDRVKATRTLTSTAMGATPYIEEILRWLPEKSREGAESRDSAPSLDFYRQTKPLSLPTARILLADDNADMRDYLQRLLGQQYEVEAVIDGMAALAAVRQQQPDLVLTDVMMPGLDGFGLLRALRANPQTKELPIILLSARAGEESRIQGLEAGADDYLIKPFSARELLARVEANLKLAQLRQEATQREQAQRQEAEAAKEQLEMVLSSIRDQFAVLDRDWRYTYVNRRVIETVGMPKEELLGKSIWELFPALVDSEFEQQVRRAITQQTPVHFDYLYPTWNRWFEIHAYPSPEGLTLFVTEISDRKQAEASLQISEERLRLATEASDIGMWFWNLTEDRLVWTTFCKRLFGLDPDTEINYERFLEALHPDDRDITHAAVQQAIEQKQEYAIEYRSLWGDGSIHWILARGRAFYNEQGEPIRMMGIAQEITERKQAEVALQSQAHELSQINRLLMQTTTLINQRNQELDQFAHIVSHDLKAPLRAISNLSIWIEEDLADQIPPDTKQNLDLLRSRVSRMEALINGLLTYARIGHQDAPDERFALNELLLEIIDSLAIPPEFTIQIPSNSLTITTNRLLLSQVFTNLISNAVKHHNRPDGQIQITAQVQAQGYEFTVSDDGPGIAPQDHGRIFDIFQTLSSQDRKESTGIGLAIIKKIIERMGGKIYLESELGQGATFEFTWLVSQLDANR